MLSLHVANKLQISESELKNIKNVIFDLGGVIINIHYQATIDAFKHLGFDDFDNIYTHIKQNHMFDSFETGKMQPEVFRDELKKYKADLTDAQIDKAWNSMIGTMPAKNIDIVKLVRQKYRTFLLSNTNAIHIEYFMRYLADEYGGNPLPEMFETVYLSHEIHERKPDVSAYQYVLNNSGLKANETLFIDDLIANIEGARKAGLYAYHLKDETIAELFV